MLSIKVAIPRLTDNPLCLYHDCNRLVVCWRDSQQQKGRVELVSYRIKRKV